ncbi:MAG: YabP/YqfC family sporulation protein [Oscillospiraceae bacterium]
MKKGRSMLRLMAEAADTPQELLPGMPLIEITGSGRVLIENHGGVTEYETDRIRVRLRFGAVVIRGSRLKITRMSKCQLVISGSLLGVDLERGIGC